LSSEPVAVIAAIFASGDEKREPCNQKKNGRSRVDLKKNLIGIFILNFSTDDQ